MVNKQLAIAFAEWIALNQYEIDYIAEDEYLWKKGNTVKTTKELFSEFSDPFDIQNRPIDSLIMEFEHYEKNIVDNKKNNNAI